ALATARRLRGVRRWSRTGDSLAAEIERGARFAAPGACARPPGSRLSALPGPAAGARARKWPSWGGVEWTEPPGWAVDAASGVEGAATRRCAVAGPGPHGARREHHRREHQEQRTNGSCDRRA